MLRLTWVVLVFSGCTGTLALDGGADGLDAYRIIATGCHSHLQSGGHIAVEIGYRQKDDVTAIFQAAGYRLVAAERDFGGNDRVLVFRVNTFDAPQK